MQLMSSLSKLRLLLIPITLFLVTAIAPPYVSADCETVVVSGSVFRCRTAGRIACGSPLRNDSLCCDTTTECADYLVTADPFCGGEVGTIRTALGCIHASDPKALINQIVTWAVGIAAGAAFVTIAYSGFLMTTAAGDVKKVNEAKSFLMSALLGLALITLAVLILNFVGIQIFGLGGFGFSV